MKKVLIGAYFLFDSINNAQTKFKNIFPPGFKCLVRKRIDLSLKMIAYPNKSIPNTIMIHNNKYKSRNRAMNMYQQY